MFIPSESMFAELYDGFDDVLQKGYRAGVMIVSPSLLMLAIQVVQQIQKDARMREAADKIRTEVGLLIEDVVRLEDRVEQSRQALRHRQQGHRADRHLGGQDRGARRENPERRIRRRERRARRSSRRRCAQAGSRRIAHDRFARARAALLPRRAGGLPQAARADRAVPRLLVRPAAGAVGRDAAGVDARIRRRSRHHRAVRAGRHALHREIPLGAADRRARRAAAVALARPPPRLAGVHANAADRGDRVPRLDRSGQRRPGWSRSARCWSRPPRRRRTSWSMPSASRACRKTSRPPAWRPMSRPIASACWSRPPARCSWSAASRLTASTSRRPGTGAMSRWPRWC